MSALSKLLRDKQAGRTVRKLRDNARRRGHPIGHATIGIYLRDDHPRPSEPTLKGLAAAFGVSLPTVRKAAGKGVETKPFRLPSEADHLTRRQRAAVVEVVRAMLEPDDLIVSTGAVVDENGSEAGGGTRPDRAARGSARRSARPDPPREPRRQTPASAAGRSR